MAVFIGEPQGNHLTGSIKQIYGYRIIGTFNEIVELNGNIENTQVKSEMAYEVRIDSISMEIGNKLLLLKNIRSITLKNPDQLLFIVADFDSSIISKLNEVTSDMDSSLIETFTSELSHRKQVRKRYVSFGIDVWVPNQEGNDVIYFIDSKNMDYLPWKFWLL